MERTANEVPVEACPCDAGLVALLVGCSTTVERPVLISLPTLTAIDAAAGQPSAQATSTARPVLRVRRVAIPEYIESRRVRYRAEASTLEEWPNTFWAERIEIGVSREFVAALRVSLPAWTVCDLSCGDASPHMTLQVDLAPFDFERTARRLTARARLTLTESAADAVSPRTGGDRPALVREFAYQVAVKADSAQAQAQAMSQALGSLAADAASTITAMRP